jgi:1-acyl-sn-glycerol-3-phosphate acyltransferase
MPLPPLQSPKDPIERAAATLKSLPAVAVLGTTLLGLNAAQSASVLLLPISRSKFRSFNRWAANLWWGWCVQVAERIHGTGVIWSGDQVPEGENAIVVSNHQQMPDITFLMFLARDKQRLGDMKWMLKDVIKYVPGVGWGLLFLDSFFVKRNWSEDKNAIEQTFSRILSDDIPVWLMTFAEGTRITPDKLADSQQFARDKGLEPTAHVLLPRTKGFVASVQGLRQHLDAIYDVTIGYEGGVPTLWQYVCGYARRAHLHVRRYPIGDIPETDGEIATWLTTRFREKDQLLEVFYQQGRFPEAP